MYETEHLTTFNVYVLEGGLSIITEDTYWGFYYHLVWNKTKMRKR